MCQAMLNPKKPPVLQLGIWGISLEPNKKNMEEHTQKHLMHRKDNQMAKKYYNVQWVSKTFLNPVLYC